MNIRKEWLFKRAFVILGMGFLVAILVSVVIGAAPRMVFGNGYRWGPLIQVKERTSNHPTYESDSHVMEYGTKDIKTEKVDLDHGFNSKTVNLPMNDTNLGQMTGSVSQRDAEILFLWQSYKMSSDMQRAEAMKQLMETMSHRARLDSSVYMIEVLLFGPSISYVTRGEGQGAVDDWDCLESMVQLFEKYCGPLGDYGVKHTPAFANICNSLVKKEAVEETFIAACGANNLP